MAWRLQESGVSRDAARRLLDDLTNDLGGPIPGSCFAELNLARRRNHPDQRKVVEADRDE